MVAAQTAAGQSFNWYDIVVGVALAYGVWSGIRTGIFVEILRVVGVVAMIAAALHFYVPVGDRLHEWSGIAREPSRLIQQEGSPQPEDVIRRYCLERMPDGIVGIRVSRNDLESCSAADLHPALIRRLATAAGIEAGPVERDAIVPHGDDIRLGLETMVILQIQARGAVCWPALVRAHR